MYTNKQGAYRESQTNKYRQKFTQTNINTHTNMHKERVRNNYTHIYAQTNINAHINTHTHTEKARRIS